MLHWSLETTQITEHSLAAANDNEENVVQYISTATAKLAELASYFGLQELTHALISVSLEAQLYYIDESNEYI